MEEYLRRLDGLKKENTVASYRRDLERLASFFCEKALETLTGEQLRAYFADLSRTASATSLSRAVSAVRGYYKFLAKNQNIPDPMTGIRASDFEKKERDPVSQEDLEKLLSYPVSGIRGRRDEAMLSLLVETGMQVSELVNLNRGDVTPDGFVFCGAGARKRKIPISGQTQARLASYRALSRLQNPECDALFLGSGGERMTRQGFWKNLKDRGIECGIESCTPSALRQAFARIKIEQGESRDRVRRLLGNVSDAALREYEKKEKENKHGIFSFVSAR